MKQKKEITFEDAYKLPLKLDHGIVFTEDDNRAFDFANKVISHDGIFLHKDSKELIIDIINGARKHKEAWEYKYDPTDGWIYLKVHYFTKFILIRGWGHLTGSGGLNLPEKQAIKIQNDFADFIIKQLTRQ